MLERYHYGSLVLGKLEQWENRAENKDKDDHNKCMTTTPHYACLIADPFFV